jgi:purine-binding chemotaxis protein CheW
VTGRAGDGTAEALRAAFDAAFGRPAELPGRDGVPLLALRVAGDPVAVRVLETCGLLPARRIVPVPARRPELLGLAGIRGAAIPIYSLARLLGRGEDGPPRWIVLAAAGGDDRVGLAVAAFERHLVVAAGDLRPAAGGPAHAPELLQAEGGARPVLSVPALVRTITSR